MNLRGVKIGVGVAVMAAAAWVFIGQRQRADRLVSENAALREQVQQAAQWREENQQLVEQAKAAAERSQSENLELMRLRSQAASLRKAGEENARLKGEVGRLANQARQKPPSGEDEPEPERSPEMELNIAKMNFSRQLALAVMMYADENEGRLPTNWTAVASFRATNELPAEAAAYGLREDHFELMFRGALRDSSEPSRTILAREKETVQGADGRWFKTYVFVDGHSEVHAETNNDFAAWEQERSTQAAAFRKRYGLVPGNP